MPEIHVLQFVTGKYKGQEFPLDGANGGHVAGRSSEADLVLADDAVSRKHARFFDHRGRTWIRDLGSRNGTVVNGTAIKRHCLREGDRIAIGSSLARVVRMELNQASGSGRAGEKQTAESSTSGRSMSGSIEDIPLVDVLQWLATSRKTGTLKVRGADEGKSGSLHLRDGRVFFASIEGNKALHPQKALMRMLRWTKGMFGLDSNVISDAPVEIESSLEHMLMEAARQTDELVNLAERATLPESGDKVELVRPSPVPWRELDPEELDIVQALAEGKSWTELLDSSSTDDVSLTQSLVKLHKKNVVQY